MRKVVSVLQPLRTSAAVAGLLPWDRRGHMSTRNTVSCMAQGQAADTTAALCAAKKCGARELPLKDFRQALQQAGVYLEG